MYVRQENSNHHGSGTLHQAEARATLLQRFGIVTCNFKPAAFHRTFRAKGADNDVTTRLDAAGDLADVGNPLLLFRKKMEYCAIMPEVVRTWFQFDFGDIGDKPTHLLPGMLQGAGGTS